MLEIDGYTGGEGQSVTQEPGSWSDGSPQPAGPGRHPQAPGEALSPWARGGSAEHQPQRPGPYGYAGGASSRVMPPPPREGSWKPARVEAVAGTNFGVVHLEIAPVASGFAVGALIAGIAALLIGVLVVCFGVLGASSGWGAWVAGAFTVLGLVAGGGGVGLGVAALRQIRRSGQPGRVRFTGRGSAIGGAWCGGIGATVSLVALALVVVVQVR